MIKLYLFYFVFGFYMLFESVSMWMLSSFNGSDNMITYMAIISAGVLFLVTTGLSLFHFRIASLVGLVALVGFFPFGFHWLSYRFTYEQPILQGELNREILIATVFYAITVGYTLRNIVGYRNPVKPINLSRRVKLILVFTPAFIFTILAIIIVFRI